MKQFFSIAIAFLFCSTSLYSQINIEIKVRQTHTKHAKLFFCQKADLKLIDSSLQSSSEIFRFTLPAGYLQGKYKLTLGKNISFDFIIASEQHIALETVVFAAEDSLKSIDSRENVVFINYQKAKRKFKQQLWHLNSLIDCYSDSSYFYKQLNDEIVKVNSNLYHESKKLASDNPGLYTSNLILLEIKPLSINESSKKERTNNINNWWSEANLSDVRLINSSSLDQKTLEFIKLFFDDNFDKEQQDSSFIAASKLLLNLSADTAIKSNFRKILFKNFIETDYNETLRFLYKSAFAGLQPMKLSPEEQSIYSLPASNEIGTKVADFKVVSSEGKNYKLSKIIAKYKLVVFWSMLCPHCTEMMPELLKVYHNFKDRGFEVIAICIDEEEDGWRKYISSNSFDWINAFEPDNGKSRIIPEYNVVGTPELFLTDDKLTIISRPSTSKQLEAKLKKILK